MRAQNTPETTFYAGTASYAAASLILLLVAAFPATSVAAGKGHDGPRYIDRSSESPSPDWAQATLVADFFGIDEPATTVPILVGDELFLLPDVSTGSDTSLSSDAPTIRELVREAVDVAAETDSEDPVAIEQLMFREIATASTVVVEQRRSEDHVVHGAPLPTTVRESQFFAGGMRARAAVVEVVVDLPSLEQAKVLTFVGIFEVEGLDDSASLVDLVLPAPEDAGGVASSSSADCNRLWSEYLDMRDSYDAARLRCHERYAMAASGAVTAAVNCCGAGAAVGATIGSGGAGAGAVPGAALGCIVGAVLCGVSSGHGANQSYQDCLLAVEREWQGRLQRRYRLLQYSGCVVGGIR